MNVFDFVSPKEVFDETLAKNNLLDEAKISKLSYYFKKKLMPAHCVFLNFDLQLEEIETVEDREPVKKQKANLFLNQITEIDLQQLLLLAEFSPMLKTQTPTELKYMN